MPRPPLNDSEEGGPKSAAPLSSLCQTHKPSLSKSQQRNSQRMTPVRFVLTGVSPPKPCGSGYSGFRFLYLPSRQPRWRLQESLEYPLSSESGGAGLKPALVVGEGRSSPNVRFVVRPVLKHAYDQGEHTCQGERIRWVTLNNPHPLILKRHCPPIA